MLAAVGGLREPKPRQPAGGWSVAWGQALTRHISVKGARYPCFALCLALSRWFKSIRCLHNAVITVSQDLMSEANWSEKLWFTAPGWTSLPPTLLNWLLPANKVVQPTCVLFAWYKVKLCLVTATDNLYGLCVRYITSHECRLGAHFVLGWLFAARQETFCCGAIVRTHIYAFI